MEHPIYPHLMMHFPLFRLTSISELRPHWLVTGCKDGIVRVFDLGDPATTNAVAPAPAPESTSFFGSFSSSSPPSFSSSMSTTPVYELRGHSERVFHTQWSPLVRDMLCSGSDDRTIGVWQLPARDAAKHMVHGSGDGSGGGSGPVSAALRGFLRGHTSNVRALVWHTELPHVLLSGSWDGTIRYDLVSLLEQHAICISLVEYLNAFGLFSNVLATLLPCMAHSTSSVPSIPSHRIASHPPPLNSVWDVRTMACTSVLGDHHADVYGLCAHPLRPFLFVSSSRDTSIRVWTMVWESYDRSPLLILFSFTGIIYTFLS